jgi:hypothetical protein
MWGGMKYKGKHDEQHDIVAHNHGVYYLVRKGIRPMQDGKRMVQP